MERFVKTSNLTKEDKQEISKMCGKIMLGILEGTPNYKIADELHIYPWTLDHNIDEMLYDLRRRVGWKRYLKVLFRK